MKSLWLLSLGFLKYRISLAFALTSRDSSSARLGWKAGQPIWPSKGGNANGTAFSPYAAPFDISRPSWQFHSDAIVHTSPTIDGLGNVYMTRTDGRVISMDKHGVIRWTYQASGRNVGIPALSADTLFSCGDDGMAFALSLQDGSVRWRTRAGKHCPSDSFSTMLSGSTLILPANERDPNGNCEVVALSPTDGKIQWRFSMCHALLPIAYNMLPSITADKVIFSDHTGGVHALSLNDGSLIWSAPGPNARSQTTGAMVTGPNGLVYVGFVSEGIPDAGKGMVRALDMHDGALVWERALDTGINVGPALGILEPGGPLTLVVLESNNFMPPLTAETMRQASSMTFPGNLIAMDAATGETRWSFHIGEKKGWGYKDVARGCLPDAAGNPAIGSDGTIYLNWSGGSLFAIRDSNADGRIDAEDPREVSTFHHGDGSNSQSAVGPGMLVAATCNGFIGYLK